MNEPEPANVSDRVRSSFCKFDRLGSFSLQFTLSWGKKPDRNVRRHSKESGCLVGVPAGGAYWAPDDPSSAIGLHVKHFRGSAELKATPLARLYDVTAIM